MPQVSKSSSHLYLKGNIFYFRQSVPADLRPYVGQSEVRVSLRTGFRAKARPQASQLASSVSHIIKHLRGMISMGFQEDVRKQWEEYIKSALAAFDNQAFEGKEPFLPTDKIDSALQFYKETLGQKDYDKLLDLMNDIYSKCGDSLNIVDAKEKRICAHEFALSQVKFYQILKHRSQGDYEYEKGVFEQPSPVVQQEIITEPATVKDDLLLSDAIERYRDCQIKDGLWNDVSAKDIPSTLHNFLEIVGDVTLRQIDRDSMRNFKDTFAKLPPRRNLDQRYRDKTITEIIALPPHETVKPTTVKNNLRNTNSFLTWCLNEGYIDSHPGLGLKIKDDTPVSEYRDPFTRNDLITIFHSDRYIGDRFRAAYVYWAPILALYTGARREEIAQLHVDDILEVDGLWVMSVNMNKNRAGLIDKKLKNPSAKRLIPLHSFLVNDLNFPSFVEYVRSQGHERVFPDLTKKNDKYGEKLGRHFTRFKQGLTFEKGKGDKVFHSFRHSFAHFYKMAQMQDDVFKQVFGHKLKDLGKNQYGGDFSVEQCYEDVISKLDYGVDLSHLTKSKWIAKGK